MKEKYKSKIDAWYIAMILATIMLMTYCIFLVKGIELIFLACIFSFETFILLATLFYTYYIFEEEYIDIRCGLLHIKLKYSDIQWVKFAKSYYSSAALSRDKIEIREKNKGFLLGTTYISPIKKQEVYDILISKVKSN